MLKLANNTNKFNFKKNIIFIRIYEGFNSIFVGNCSLLAKKTNNNKILFT